MHLNIKKIVNSDTEFLTVIYLINSIVILMNYKNIEIYEINSEHFYTLSIIYYITSTTAGEYCNLTH